MTPEFPLGQGYFPLAMQCFFRQWLHTVATGYMSNHYQQEMEIADIVDRTERILLHNLTTFNLIEKYVTEEHWITKGMGQSY